MNRGEHARYRQLISDRLDGQLSVLEERQLVRHMLACAECRAVHNDYHEQRRTLRALPAQSPPRDLWARTSAGLDRELARRSWPGAGGSRRLPRAALAGTVVALGVALLVGTSQLGLAPQPQTASGSPRLLLPTPFGVAPQRIAFLGSEAGGMVLYRAEVNQVCPTSALSCLVEEDLSPQVIALPRGVTPSNLSVSPDGDRLAVTSSQSVVALVLGSELDGQQPDPPDLPPDRPSSEPAATAGLTAAPAGTPAAHPTAQAASPVPVVSPAVPGSPATEPSLEPPSPDLPAGTEPPDTTPPDQPAESPAQSLTAVVVLDDVHAVGAPPAWAANGELLAFSAMPADASQGPDVYVWREGAETAVRLTDDGLTYFASWAGQRIVASRVLLGEADGPATLSTVLIDPATGLEQLLPLADVWLPQVSPLGDRAVVWQGSMDFSSPLVRPLTGALYLVDWSAVDPAPQAPTAPPAEATHAPASPAATAGLPESSPRVQPEVSAPPAGSSPTPDEPSVDQLSPEPAAGSASPALAPETEAGPTAGPGPRPAFELIDLDPERDPVHDPVLDWQVRWASDGTLLGYWLADAAGASWGHLSVLAIEEVAGRLRPAESLLGPTLARRNFTLGADRVAWVGPSDSAGDGELRIRTWGPGGEGGLDLPELDLREVVPAF